MINPSSDKKMYYKLKLILMFLLFIFQFTSVFAEPFSPCAWNEKALVIDCTSINLQSVPRFEPAGKNVKYFNLMSNIISVIADDALKPLASTLESFQIIQNRPKSTLMIDSKAFSDLPRLREITVSNDIAPTNRIAFNIFVQSTSNLENLDIENIPLKSLAMFSAPKLRKMRLSKVSLRKGDIDADTFEKLPNLEQLILDQICESNENCFENFNALLKPLVNLKYLDISRNDIGRLGYISFPESMSKLETLIMSSCKISDQFFLEMTFLKSLTTFHLSENPLTGMDNNKFANIVKLPLKLIDLSDTKIAKIPPFISQLSATLEELILFNTNIYEITKGSIDNLVNLRSLSLYVIDSSQILYINSFSFDKLTKLSKLYLGNADRVTFEQGSDWNTFLLKLSQLKYLQLQNLKLDDSFINISPTMSNLLTLDLMGNQISLSNIDRNIFQKYPKLQILILKSNAIAALKDDAFNGLNFNSIKLLDVSNNRIAFIESCAFGSDPSKEGTQIEIVNNNLECNCGLMWMQSHQQLWHQVAKMCPSIHQQKACPTALTCKEKYNAITTPSSWPTDLPTNFGITFSDFNDRIVVLHLNGLTENHMEALFTKVEVTMVCKSDNTEINIRITSPSTRIELAHPGEYYTYCVFMHFKHGDIVKKCYSYKINETILSAAYIAAIVICPLIVIGLIVLIIFLVKKNRRRNRMSKYRQSNGSSNNRESFHPLQQKGEFFEHEGQPLGTFNLPGSRIGMSMYASNHSLARSTHSLSEMHDPNDSFPPVERRYKRAQKLMSKSMDMLDSAPGQRPQTKMYRRSQWQSSTDILRERRQSTVSNRLPLSISLAYIQSGYEPPHVSHPPLPEPPRESTYEEIPDVMSPGQQPGTYCHMTEEEPYMEPESSCASHSFPPMVDQNNPYYAHSMPGNASYNNHYNSYIAPRVDQHSNNGSMIRGAPTYNTGSLY